MNEQAGIYAGDEGYDINVNKHTDLKGALITSTQKAEEDGKNHFSTSSLTHSDIENHSNYSGSSFGVSGSVSANFETPFGENGAAQSTKQATDKDGNLLYTDKNGNTTVNSKGVDGQENTKKLAEGKESLQFSYGMGYGKDSDSQSSTTKSGINTQNIIIKDEAEQLKRTGKTVQEEIAAIKTDITTESAQSQSGKLENRFNKDDVQKELDFQREVTEKFGPNVAEAGSLLANKFGEEAKAKRNEAAIALEEAEKAKAENNNETNRALVKQARDNFETASREAKEWETGGSQRLVIDSALNVISTALAGRPAAEVVASGLSPTVNNQIKKATTDAKGNVNTALNLTAHALWGAVEAYAGNRNVAAGAAGAAGGEAAAHFLSSTLYDKSPEKLSEEEKRTVSSLSQVAAGIAGGSLSDSSDGAIIAAKTAKDAVENNDLSIRDNERVAKLEENLDKRGYLYPAELEEAKKLLNKSDLVDFLLSKAQKNKGNLHPELKKYLDTYLSEIAWDIVHTEARNGVRITHEEAMKRLYDADLSKQMKPHYPSLVNAIEKDKVLNDNWSRKLEKSNLEAIALFGGPGAGTALVKGVTMVENVAVNVVKNTAINVGDKAFVAAVKAENKLNKTLPVVNDALNKAYVNGQLTYADIVGKGVNGAREYVRTGVKNMGEQGTKVANVGDKAFVAAVKAENKLNKTLPVVNDALNKAYVNGQLTYADIVGKGVNGAREYVRTGVKNMGEQGTKVALTNAVAAGGVKAGFEANDYANGKQLTRDNLLKSTKEVGYSFFSAGATTGMPILPVIGLGVTVDWAKDGGKYDVTKTVGSNIVGSAIEAKLGNSFATPYLREAGTNVFDKVYDTLGKENNEKK